MRELYYNQLATTFILDQPDVHGTPGARNSTYKESIGPTYRNLAHHPAVPEPGEDVTVSIDVDDPDGVGGATLFYRIDGKGDFSSVVMVEAAKGHWTGVLPGQTARKIVQFYVQTVDRAFPASASTAPARGPDSRALVKWDDRPAVDTHQHLRLIMIPTEARALHRNRPPRTSLQQAGGPDHRHQ